MATTDVTGWETAVLNGGPADGLRMTVSGRPPVVQVSYACRQDSPSNGVQVAAVYVYRRDLRAKSEPLQYHFDVASP
ncbi:hypothetical protein ACWD5Q_24375 [Streptomyces sp. NPDC002513]